MEVLVDAMECVIFASYFVISCIVAYLFVRHRAYVDTWVSRLLLTTAGLFFMLCALTHLYSVWTPEPPVILLVLCATVSFLSAVCIAFTFRELDDYLRLRLRTMTLMREEIVSNLTKGYDLKVCVVGNVIVSGEAGSHLVSQPLFIDEGFHVGDLVNINDRYFRIVNIVKSFVQIGDNVPRGDEEELDVPAEEKAQVYGYDATAEVRMKNEAERMNRMKIKLCLSTAHHVRTPLSCIGVALTCLRSRIHNKESTDMIDEAFVHYELINMVVTQFMDVAAVDSNFALTPCVDYVDVRELVERVKRVLMRVQAEEVRCKCLVEECVPNFVLTDSAWLMQILINLATETATHTFTGEINVIVTLEFEVLIVVVETTGHGVTVAYKCDIFDQDFVDDGSSCEQIGSPGIGMFSVKTKVGALRGECSVISEPEEGTTVVVKIPVRVDQNCFSRCRRAIDDKVRVAQVRSVLVIDDTASVRKLMRYHLKDHRVEVAINGVDGLQKMKEKKTFDLVLLDIMMPVLDGVECLKRFRKWEVVHRKGHRQVIYCVSATSVELELGFDGYIPKPIDTKRLRELLRTLY